MILLQFITISVMLAMKADGFIELNWTTTLFIGFVITIIIEVTSIYLNKSARNKVIEAMKRAKRR